MNEAKRKQDEMSSEDNVKEASLESSEASSTSTKVKDETENNVCTQVLNTQLYTTLSTDSNKEAKESLKTTVHNDNSVLVAKHYNSLGHEGTYSRNRSRILYMRNFNNWIKSMLIVEYTDKLKQNKVHGSSIKVLDMCCGKGGDLLKWEKRNVSHMICADLAEISIKQCEDRYTGLARMRSGKRGSTPIFSAEFIAADCTKVHLRSKFKDPSIKLDFVSCQFAFHYCFESLPQAECMMKNASECLKPGGYFIGTIPDAYTLASRWQKCDGDSFGNEIYNIEFCSDKAKPPLFGAKYHFQLEGRVNCPEFLVYLPVFCKLARKFGLELVIFKRFDEYYEHMKDTGKFLINKMQALEIYPPHQGMNLVGKPEQDYQHAKQHLQNRVGHKIGTLSQSEWDIITLYAVFVFKKMETVWDSKGKPKYVK